MSIMMMTNSFWQLYWDRSLLITFRTLLVFATVLIIFRLWVTSKYRNLPPGPFGFPLFGFLPFLGTNFHLKLTSLGHTFGSVYQLFLGTKRIIVISDHNIVREAFKRQEFSGRPDTELTKLLEGYGIIHSDGARWKEQRAFLHSVLREFGAKSFSRAASTLEVNIKTQIRNVLVELDDTCGTPYRIRPSVARAVSNVVGTLLMSRTYAQNDGSFERLLKLIEEGFSLITMSVPVNFIPFVRYIPCLNYAYQKIKSNKQETSNYFKQEAEKHRRELIDTNTPKDFVDAFLLRQKYPKKDGKPSFFTEEQLVQMMGDIFSAGLETVTSTLEWCVLFMIRNPDVQRKVQEELDMVVGDSRLPCLDDMPNLPYTEATVLETLRRGNIVALGNSHAAIEDTELAGFFIPKNSHVLPNIWAIHMDPTLWDDPERFNPERFLEDGKVKKPSYFMPFSVGRRMCVGDVLARMEAFLFLSCILHMFELRVPDGQAPPPVDGIAAASMTTRPFEICAFPRKDLPPEESDLESEEELEAQPELELVPELQPEIEVVPELQPELELVPELQPELELVPELQPELELVPELQPELELVPELQPELELVPELQPELELVPELQPELELVPELQPELELVPELQPELELSPEFQPELKLVPELQTEVELKLKPDVESDSESELESEIIAQMEFEREFGPSLEYESGDSECEPDRESEFEWKPQLIEANA